MRFIVDKPDGKPRAASRPESHVLLRKLRWDDHGHQTLYQVELVRNGHASVSIGFVKIACFESDHRELDDEFEALSEDCCSLGQSWDYYQQLRRHGIRDDLLIGLRDLSTMTDDARVRVQAAHTIVARSLLRFTTARHALARCLAQKTGPYEFTVIHKVEGFAEPHRVDFNFDTDRICGRIVVLVGENGTGKTRLLQGLMWPVLGVREVIPGSVTKALAYPSIAPRFSFILMLSFSAFDPFSIPRFPIGESFARYAGLRHRDSDWNNRYKVSLETAFDELNVAYRRLQMRGRIDEWREALKEHGLRPPDHALNNWLDTRSAGQKFIFFTLTHIFAYVDEQALLLFDEPEQHSHPAMLTLLMKQLRQVLARFDAFAIVATHSPIVLQETPARQVRVFRRQGRYPLISRYPGECFAENLNEIVRRGFGLDEDDRNYKKLLASQVANQRRSVEQVRRELDRMGLAGYLALEQLSGERE